MKRGAEQTALQPQLPPPQQSQALTQLTPELYAPKVDARDSYSASYAQSPYGASPYAQTPYYPSSLPSAYDPYSKASSTAQNALASSPYYQSSYSSYNSNPYGLLGAYGSPYGASSAANFGASGAPNYGAAPPSNFAASPYAGASGPPPYYYYPPYYYPNYYGQPPYPPPPPGYPGAPSKHQNDDDDDYEDEKRREKGKKTGSSKNRLRNSDRDSNTEYVDGANYIISSSKDLDGESSSHRSPSPYNQIEQDPDVQPRSIVPKATYRLVSISGQQPTADYNAGPSGYIKVQQLEQLMRQALARLLAQNAAQQANLQQIQQEVNQQQASKDNQQYISIPNTIAKTGLSYVVNPTIINRANPGQYNPSQLLHPVNKQSSYVQKAATSVTLQHSPGIYIPPHKNGNEQSSPPEYGDYDAPESITPRNHATAEPTRASYPYSTYRPTQQTSLEDVNFGTKHKTKS